MVHLSACGQYGLEQDRIVSVEYRGKIPTWRVKLDFTQEAAHMLCSGGRQALGTLLLRQCV